MCIKIMKGKAHRAAHKMYLSSVFIVFSHLVPSTSYHPVLDTVAIYMQIIAHEECQSKPLVSIVFKVYDSQRFPANKNTSSDMTF